MKNIIYSLIAFSFFFNNSFGQDNSVVPSANPGTVPILIADSSSTGTYATLISQLKPYIADQIDLQEVAPPLPGATNNMNLLLTNKVQLALMHSDVYVYQAKQDPTIKDKFQVVVPLYSEEVHFLALRTSKRYSGGSWISKGTPLDLKSIEDLSGLNVGATGGGVISAQVIKFATNVPYNFVKYNSGAEVMAALNSGDIDAAVFVGGQPMTSLLTLDNKYKFLSVSDDDADKMKMIYHRAKLNTYTNIGDEVTQTVAADCVVVGRVVTVPKFVNALAAFRNNLDAHLSEIQQTPGSHPKWSEVQPSSQYRGDLPFMKLPGNSVTPVPSLLPQR